MSDSVGEIVGAVIAYCVDPLRFSILMKTAISKHNTTEATPQNSAAIPLFLTVEFITIFESMSCVSIIYGRRHMVEESPSSISERSAGCLLAQSNLRTSSAYLLVLVPTRCSYQAISSFKLPSDFPSPTWRAE